jgi:hypothetical protein
VWYETGIIIDKFVKSAAESLWKLGQTAISVIEWLPGGKKMAASLRDGMTGLTAFIIDADNKIREKQQAIVKLYDDPQAVKTTTLGGALATNVEAGTGKAGKAVGKFSDDVVLGADKAKKKVEELSAATKKHRQHSRGHTTRHGGA